MQKGEGRVAVNADQARKSAQTFASQANDALTAKLEAREFIENLKSKMYTAPCNGSDMGSFELR